MTDANQVWAECLSYMSSRINKQSFFTWLKPTSAIGSNNGNLQIGVPNQFVATWIEEHYAGLISDALRFVTNQEIPFDLIIRPTNMPIQPSIFDFDVSQVVKGANPSLPQQFGVTVPVASSFADRYVFESFVVGDSNEFAYAAAEAVSKSPGKMQYNPLFIYGGVGLGKTHLAQAIGNYMLTKDASRRTIYVTSEKFTNEFIAAISSKSVHDFSNYYRSAEILIIEDIQFFTGKESTQEQFFHTFNTLHQAGKQLVLTADRAPRDIKGLEERLLSRFQWGLVTDIQPPLLETRIAILSKKAEQDGYQLPVEVLTFIADSVTTNIRDLEGCLTRLIAYASLRRREINVDVAQHVLKDFIPHRKMVITIEDIQKKVGEVYSVSVETMQARKKTANVALSRQVAMYLCREMTEHSLKTIGKAFGNRDHSTVIHAHRTVVSMMKKDINLKLKIDQLQNSLYV